MDSEGPQEGVSKERNGNHGPQDWQNPPSFLF